MRVKPVALMLQQWAIILSHMETIPLQWDIIQLPVETIQPQLGIIQLPVHWSQLLWEVILLLAVHFLLLPVPALPQAVIIPQPWEVRFPQIASLVLLSWETI